MRTFLLVVVVSALVQAFWARTVFLFSDDYIFLTQGLKSDLTWTYLRQPLFGHFSPVSRLIDHAVAPAIADQPWLVYAMLVGAASAVVAGAGFLMTGALGRSRPALLGTALVGISLTLPPLTNWYTAGMNILPAVAGAFVCFGAFVRLLRAPHRWWSVLAVAAYLVAVLSWELAAVIPLYVVAWAVLLRPDAEFTPYRVLVRRGGPAGAAIVVIALAMAINYLNGYYAAQPSGLWWQVAVAAVVSLVQTLVPLALGVYATGWGVLGVLVPVVTTVVLVVIVRASLRRGPEAWRGWTFAALGWMVPAVVVVLNRVGVFGISVAQQPMYFLLPVTLATLGALAAFASRPGSTGRSSSGRALPRPPRGAVVAVTALLALTYVCSGPAVVNSLFTYALAKYGTPEPDYASTLAASARLLEAGPAYSVLDGDVPGGLVPPTFAPYNRVHTVLDLYAPGVAVNAPGPPWYRADETGELRPATVDWVRTVSFGTLTTANVSASGVRGLTVDSRRGLCFVVEKTDAVVVVPLPEALPAGVGALRTSATFAQPSEGRVIFLSPRGWASESDSPQRWTAGASVRLNSTDAAGSRAVGFDSMPPGASVCVTSIEVGTVSSP